MSFKCGFRGLADQVKQRLVSGSRSRSASSHECHCSRDDKPYTSQSHPRGLSCRPEDRTYQETNISVSLISEVTATPATKWCGSDTNVATAQAARRQESTCKSNPAPIINRANGHPKDPLVTETSRRSQRTGPNYRQCAKQTLTMVTPSTSSADHSNVTNALDNHCRTNTAQLEIHTPGSVRSAVVTSRRESVSVAKMETQPITVRAPAGTQVFTSNRYGNFHSPKQDPQYLTTSANCPLQSNARRTSKQACVIPDLSVPEGEIRSSSLGNSYSCTNDMPMFPLRANLSHCVLSPWREQARLQEQDDIRRLALSYSGLTDYHSDTGLKNLVNPHSRHTLRDHSPSSLTQSSTSNIMFESVSSASPGCLNTLVENSANSSKVILHAKLTNRGAVSQVASRSFMDHRQPAYLPLDDVTKSSVEAVPALPTRSTSLRGWDNKYCPTQLDRRERGHCREAKANQSMGMDTSYSTKQSVRVPNCVVQEDDTQRELNIIRQASHSRSRSDASRTYRRRYVNTELVAVAPSRAAVTDAVDLPTAEMEGETSTTIASRPQPMEKLVKSHLLAQMSRSVIEHTGLAIESCRPTDTAMLSVPELAQYSHSMKHIASSSNVPSSPSCGFLEQLMPMNHASRLLGRMSDKLRDGRLADVILFAGRSAASTSSQPPSKTDQFKAISTKDFADKGCRPLPAVRIPAHRVILAAASDYFAAMFGNEHKEASETEIWIHDVEPSALQTLIDYIYTGHLDLREETVEDVLEAACFLQMPEASQACERFLIKRLHGSNCLGMARLGEQHGCHLLHQKATKYALEHFTDVVQQPDYLNLSQTELTDLLSSDHLRVPNEATVFAACLRWVRDRMSEQKEAISQESSVLSELLKHVRLYHLPARLLADVLEKEPLFHNDLKSIHMLLSALRYHLSPEPRTVGMLSSMYSSSELNCSTVRPTPQTVGQSPGALQRRQANQANQSPPTLATDRYSQAVRQAPRPSTIGRLWALGGKTMTTTRALQEILEYDPYWNSWRIVGHLPGQRQQCGCIVLNDGRLLVVGGRDELKTLSIVECIYAEELSKHGEMNVSKPVTLKRGERNGAAWNPGDYATSPRRNPACQSDPDHSTLTKSMVDGNSESRGTNDSPNHSDHQPGEVANSQPSGWHIVSSMATHRHGLGVAVLEGVVYAVGGHDGWSYLNTVERWNGRAKSWSPVAPMAVQRSTVGVAALDGLLYAVGGRDGTACLRTVERFNPHTQHWCFIAPMLHRRGGVGVGAVGGRLYAVGGHNAPPSQPHSLRTASVEVYEPQTDMWSEVACLSSPRDSIAVTTLGTRLYALGGHDGQVYTDRVQVFDPEANEWSDIAPLPSGRAGIAVASSSTPASFNQSLGRLPYYRADPLA
ncbi:putative bacteriochlorophyll 4-vinyl reductase [Paragonimus heterotremus]|uniref:Putative bacteriochlorophyll 4-vinyl reductase n=1 Tax=Paragonimus heterotremus TaxID=100268 RepID=A0A8J4SNU2_9TREM|nr:putative bacteriochlorophyll 4-vinyl reductase [Paragonimus heterotremus]